MQSGRRTSGPLGHLAEILSLTLAGVALLLGGETSFAQPCAGDCDRDGNVAVAELIVCVRLGLGFTGGQSCPECSGDDDVVQVTDLVRAVANSIHPCPTATATSTGTPTPTETATSSATPTETASATPSPTPTDTATPLPTSTSTSTTVPSATPSVTPGEAVCGNGTREGGEECDDRSVCTGVGEVLRCYADEQCPVGQTCGASGFCLCSGENTGCPAGQQCSPEGFCFLSCAGPGECPTGECRPVGGDGCAANCTLETRRVETLAPCQNSEPCTGSGADCSGACIQSIVLPVPVALNGTPARITGAARDELVIGPEAQIITNPGEVPVAIKAADNDFTPTSVFNTICACIKAVPNPLFGPGNSGAGVIGCGAQGLTNVDFLIEQDHNTTPGSIGNGGGFPDDPSCTASINTAGIDSSACRERDDPACEQLRYLHPGICNSPRQITFSGGLAPRGSTVIFNSTSMTQLSDGGACRTNLPPGPCPFPDYGPDCLPCTRDDAVEMLVNVVPATTGTASVTILDANNRAGTQPLEAGATCGGTPCKVADTGEAADCDMLQGNGSLGGILVSAFPTIDSMTLRDTVTTLTLVGEAAPVCGNGVVEAGEDCDDGGFCAGDSSNIDCEDNKPNTCPDGRACVNRFCVCTNNDQCESGQECVQGFCMLRCTKTADCPSGMCRPQGGDDCSANCTNETSREAPLDSANSPSRVQTTNTVIDLNLVAIQRFRTGGVRDDRPVDPQGDVISEPGEIPVVIKADATNGPVFDPVPVPGLVCACVRQVPVPDLFGPNNSGVGKIGCGQAGLTDIDYKIVQDHNTNPGNPNNGTTSGAAVPQLPNDPECDDEFTFASGLVSGACKELSGNPVCNDPAAFFHVGICNGPRQIEFAGGPKPRGAGLIDNSTAIGLLADNGACRLDKPMVNGQCRFRDYGPDCLPCTPDDVDMGIRQNLPATTGSAKAAVYDAGNVKPPGSPFPIPIDEGSENACSSDGQCAPHEKCRRSCTLSGFPCTADNQCPEGEVCQPPQCEVQCFGIVRCLIEQQGTPFDCDALLADPAGGLSGAALAVTFPQIDAKRIGDNVTASILTLQ